MFFGLTNSLETFQMMMNDIFRELIDEGVVVIYMDDILILGGQTKEEHHEIHMLQSIFDAISIFLYVPKWRI